MASRLDPYHPWPPPPRPPSNRYQSGNMSYRKTPRVRQKHKQRPLTTTQHTLNNKHFKVRRTVIWVWNPDGGRRPPLGHPEPRLPGPIYTPSTLRLAPQTTYRIYTRISAISSQNCGLTNKIRTHHSLDKSMETVPLLPQSLYNFFRPFQGIFKAENLLKKNPGFRWWW